MSYQRVPLSGFNDLVPLVCEEAHLYEIRELVQAGILSSVKSAPQRKLSLALFFLQLYVSYQTGPPNVNCHLYSLHRCASSRDLTSNTCLTVTLQEQDLNSI